MESSAYAPVQQDQVHCMDLFPYGSNFESEVKFTAKNPTVEPYNATESIINENTPAETPNGGWKKTSWPDFDEFTRLGCGDHEHSPHPQQLTTSLPPAAIQMHRCKMQ
jgi:hypothetical protein